ncbi:MAPEG family protein [Dokdonella sp.]|uniref:MAPEG family protein n=1 Tax=Dokdonella sp. TaxID=2291710 RepID=UPI002F40291D
MHITGIYAAFATLLVLVLAMRTSLGRHGKRISVGDGGDDDMFLRIRAHANAIENLPLALILLGMLEWNQTRPLWLHAFGCVLIAGRVLHAFGMSVPSFSRFGRVSGTFLTWTVMGVMAVLLLWQWLAFASMA